MASGWTYADYSEMPHEDRQHIRINIDDNYMYCVATSDKSTPVKFVSASGTGSTSDIKLHKGERKIIERMVLGDLLKRQSKAFVQSTVKINNSSFLRPVPKDNNSGSASPTYLHQESPSTQYSALVISWNGRGAPPEKLHFKTVAASHQDLDLEDSIVEELPYTRVWNHGDVCVDNQLRFHWSKVALFGQTPAFMDDTILEGFGKTLQRATNETEFTLYHVPCKLQATELGLKEILSRLQWSTGSNLTDQNHWRDILHSIHQHEFGSEAKVAHGTTMYEELEQHAKVSHGLEGLVGQKHTLYLDAQENFVPTHQTRSKLFLPSTSVASFMLNYFGGVEDVKAKLQDGSIQDILRGKLVEFKLDGAKVIKGIESVSPIAALNVTDSEKHSSWRGKINTTLRIPELPCINVGTKFRPALLAPEMAKLVPGQTSKRIQDPDFQPQADAPIKISLADADERFPTNIARTSVALRKIAPQPKQAHKSAIPQLVENNVDQSIRIIFVVPDVESVNTALWRAFQTAMRHTLKTQKAVAQPIVLSYRSGEDPTKLWKAQLMAAKNCGEGVPLAIVALRNDEHHAFLYRTIKTLCEVDVGLQSVFIKLNTLEQKEARNPGRGALMTAKVIAKKVALRSLPPVQTLGNGDQIDITVAVHIGQFNVTAPMPKEDGGCTLGSEASKSLYVLTLSSRDTQKSQMYRTSTELLGPESVHEVRLADRVERFVKELATGAETGLRHRITIVRSGYVPESRNVQVSDKSLRLLPEHTFDDDDGPGNKKAEPMPMLKNKMINTEVSVLANRIKWLLGPDTSVSYVLLSEHKDFVLPDKFRQSIAVDTMDDNDSAKASYFAVDRGYEETGGGFIGSHRLVHVANKDKVISMALLGNRLSDSVAGLSKFPEISRLVEMDPRMAGNEGNSQARVPQVCGKVSQEDLAVKKNCITEHELTQLSNLWYDERLELSNTKWPVPTYLAHLATKRAQFHLTFDDFDGASDTAPCKLRPVHDDVKDTLYFL